MAENLLIMIFFFIILILQLILVVILYIRSKDTLQLIHTLQEEVSYQTTKDDSIEQSINDVKLKDEDSIKKDTPLKETDEKMSTSIKNEEVIFYKELELDGKKKLIEMDIQADSKSK